jgi:hypothetical protein
MEIRKQVLIETIMQDIRDNPGKYSQFFLDISNMYLYTKDTDQLQQILVGRL